MIQIPSVKNFFSRIKINACCCELYMILHIFDPYNNGLILKKGKNKYTAVLIFVMIWIVMPQTALFSHHNFVTSPTFKRITNDEGLSQGTINAITQDDLGFIWIGTNDGLNRYDGNDFLVFRNRFRDSTSISSNEISDILVDREGILWIGTTRGLNYFNPLTSTFRLVREGNLNESTNITVIEPDGDSILWVGTKKSGLFRLNLENGLVKQFMQLSTQLQVVSANEISHLFSDSGGRLWISFLNGDFGYMDQRLVFTRMEIFPVSSLDKSFNRVTGIVENDDQGLWISSYGRSIMYMDLQTMKPVQLRDLNPAGPPVANILTSVELMADSLLWFGTDMDGLGLYNIHTNSITYFLPGRKESNILYRTVSTLFTDRKGNLWIGTNGKGLNVLGKQQRIFSLITPNSSETMRLRFSSVRCILQENDSTLWVGGYEGLQKFNPIRAKTTDFFDILPYCICQDEVDSNKLWIGTEGMGIRWLDKSKRIIFKIPMWQNLQRKNGPPPELYGGNIYSLVNLDEDHLLAGTNIGLIVLDKNTLDYKLYEYNAKDENSIIYGDINSILIDSRNRIWLTSMQGGLSQFLPDKETFQRIDLHKEGISGGFNRITGIFEDHRGHLWMGTNYGAVELNEKAIPLRQITTEDGLPNNTIYAIISDGTSHLWMSTNMGIVRYNPTTGEILNYNKNNGLPANEFNSGAYFRNGNRTLYFGSVDGVAYFHPSKISNSPFPEKVVVTEAEVIGNGSHTNYSVAYNNNLYLQPGQKMVRLRFSALQYAPFVKTRFAFRLDDENNNWVDMEKDRNLTITLSRPGSHLLEIIADNGTGIWSENPTQLEIYLKPEYYQTNWFKGLVLMIGFSMIAVVYFIRVNIIKQQKNKLEKLVSQRTNQLRAINNELEEANRSKDQFLSVIAHDLKSPFNALLGFSDILASDWEKLKEDEKVEFIRLIRQTAEDTYQMLINLLEWARLQKQKIEFTPGELNLKKLADDSIRQHNGDAFFKNIRISNQIVPGVKVFADENMLHSVFRNLLSNAIKFTPKNGKVNIKAFENNEHVRVCITDNGVGMTKADAENLFRLQYRNSAKGTEGETGTGLGLVLCYEFIKKHAGNISVESEPGKGSTFCFTIPKNFKK